MNQQRELSNNDNFKKKLAKPLAAYKQQDLNLPEIRVPKKVCVTHGANQDYYQLAGLSVTEAKQKLRDAMNVPSDASTYISKKLVDDNYIIKEEDRIEFLKEAGVKGGSISSMDD